VIIPRPEDTKSIAALSEGALEEWLRVALESLLIAKRGPYHFGEVAPFIEQNDDYATDIAAIFETFDFAAKSRFRAALAKLLSHIPATHQYLPVYCLILRVAEKVEAKAILSVLHVAGGNRFLALIGDQDADSIYADTLTTATSLSNPGNAAEVLQLVFGSAYFDHAYSAKALVACCKAAPHLFVEHVRRLRESMGAMLREFKTTDEGLRKLGSDIVAAQVGPGILVHALPAFRYHGGTSEQWLVTALFSGPTPLLACSTGDSGFDFWMPGSPHRIVTLEESTGHFEVVAHLRVMS
jgi:hypothetical protein